MRLRNVKKVFAGLMAAGMIASMPGMTNLVYAGEVMETAEGSVEINETNFPDRYVRDSVFKFDTNGDHVLSQAEIEAVTRIWVGNDPGGFPCDAKGIEYFTNLEVFGCSENGFKELNLSNNEKLKELYLGHNYCKEPLALSVSENLDLEVLSFWMSGIKELDLRNNTKLRKLECELIDLSTLDLSNNTELEELVCSGNQLEYLDLSHNTKLQTVDCRDNYLFFLDVSNSPQISKLDLSDNNVNVWLFIRMCGIENRLKSA